MSLYSLVRRPALQEIEGLIRACEARLVELRIAELRDITELVDRISRQRNRPIHLIPIATNAEAPSGLWFALDQSDLIVYEAETSQTHQGHIIAHELSHMVCGHQNASMTGLDGTHSLFPDLEPSLVRDMLSRSGYSDRHEREAEVMASLILSRLRSPALDVSTGPYGSERSMAMRLRHSF